MKIAAFLITALTNIGIGVVLFFFLIIALNGYSGSQAEPGLILFIVWVLIFSIAFAVLSVFATKYLIEKRALSRFTAAIISTMIFIVAGGIFSFIGIFAAIGLIEALR